MWVLRYRPKQELSYILLGATALAALTFLLPPVHVPEAHRTARIVAYALFLTPVAASLHGFLFSAMGHATSRLLALGALAAAIGGLFALLARPEDL